MVFGFDGLFALPSFGPAGFTIGLGLEVGNSTFTPVSGKPFTSRSTTAFGREGFGALFAFDGVFVFEGRTIGPRGFVLGFEAVALEDLGRCGATIGRDGGRGDVMRSRPMG